MKRFYFLAAIAVLLVAVGLACSASSSSGGSSPSADDDASPDDDDDASGCTNPALVQCAESAAKALSTCTAACPSSQGSCDQTNCTFGCEMTQGNALIVCATTYDCPETATIAKCNQACEQAGIACLQPLSSCTDFRALGCLGTEATCVEKCPT
jgi:hypothetical protein